MFDDMKIEVEMFLDVNNIEVIYNYVILVLKGVSLNVFKGGIMVLFGGNGVGKIIMFKVIFNFFYFECGEVMKGLIIYCGKLVQDMDLEIFVKMGVVQVMEGCYCFEYLMVEENLLIGVYICMDGVVVVVVDLEKVYVYFLCLRECCKSQVGYILGGE